MNSDELFSTLRYANYYSSRYKKLDWLWRFYRGKQYEHLSYWFSQEREEGTDNYIALRKRKPAVRANFPRVVVRKTASMAFSGRNWPQIATKDDHFTAWLTDFYKSTNFSSFMNRVVCLGSIGTAVPVFSIIPSKIGKGQFSLNLDIWNARDCYPRFSHSGALEEISIRYLTSAESLSFMGIEVEPHVKYWYKRTLTRNADIVYKPIEETELEEGHTEILKQVNHNLDLVPALWVRNLLAEDYDTIDGEPTFDSSCLDLAIEIDYVLSQCGRGIRYNSDPTLVLKEPRSSYDGTGPIIRGGGNTIPVPKEGDAKLLEMQGNGQKLALDYYEKLRNIFLEILRGSRKDPQRAMSHASSGKMAEMLEDDLIALTSELRTSYGEGCVVPLTTKIVTALKKLNLGGEIIADIDEETIHSIELAWGPWFEPTSTDQIQHQEALNSAVTGNRLSIHHARNLTYHSFGLAPPRNVNWSENIALLKELEEAKNGWRMEGGASIEDDTEGDDISTKHVTSGATPDSAHDSLADKVIPDNLDEEPNESDDEDSTLNLF